MTSRHDSALIRRRHSLRRRGQHGLGLVEIMVAMALFIVMFNGLLEIFLESRMTFTATDTITRLQENGRTAVDLLTSSVRRAGYLGGNSDFDTVWGSQPPLAPDGTCATDNNTWLRMVQRGVFGLNDSAAGYACIDGGYIEGDIVTLRYASPWRVETADMVGTRLYLRSSLFEGKLFLGSEQDQAANEVLDRPQQQHQMLAYTYYIADSGRDCAGEAIPALFREAPNANNRPVAEELVAGIENMQIQYNVGDQYLDADDVTDWDEVTSVKMWILVRSECPESGYRDQRTYVLGDIPDYAPNDGYRRYLYSTVVALRNRR
jgi:type IV pilus assembly protein PilW